VIKFCNIQKKYEKGRNDETSWKKDSKKYLK
jgi:hypothetical protein